MSDFFSSKDDGITCNLCFRHCFLAEDAVGFCGVNKNSNGQLTCLVYGKPAAMQIDPIEKKPLYHFFPGESVFSIGTVGCNFRCPFCQNGSLSFSKWTDSVVKFSVEDIIEQTKKNRCRIIAFTYNEPTVSWLWYRDIAIAAKDEGIKTVLVSNGAMTPAVAKEVALYVDAANIDLKCGSSKHYKSILKGSREAVVETLEILQDAGVWLELTTLIVPGVSDSEDDLHLSANEMKRVVGTATPWHLSAYHPAHDYEEPPTSAALLLNRVDLLKNLGYVHVFPGNISVPSDTICPKCGKILIERNGYRIKMHFNGEICSDCGYTLEGRFK